VLIMNAPVEAWHGFSHSCSGAGLDIAM